MHILLTNDDGIYAPGLAALEKELRKLGDVSLVAPATEQSGVSHSITFLSPLVCKEVYDGEQHRGWAVEGSPADCVKLAITELCNAPPDLVVSGINGGLNAGINVLYSGTVAAAIEGAFFGIESIAVSLEYDPHAQFNKAAKIARNVIEQLMTHRGEKPKLYNLNIPSAALEHESRLRVVPMGLNRYGEQYEKRVDPRGREYFWATNLPAPQPGIEETDLTALAQGNVTLTALNYDMTCRQVLEEMRDWSLELQQTIS
ncbi:MAG: 5'/3'-nucleotidase SurE [Planctomycetaceae bacterium]|nr:5'/3'-nucleotidase SurE [Planctomycetaceae bacterium]|tara:strand:- start:5536 stop:6309 length:774 start_codon:yes stop_codon:yes gene_type:complete